MRSVRTWSEHHTTLTTTLSLAEEFIEIMALNVAGCGNGRYEKWQDAVAWMLRRNNGLAVWIAPWQRVEREVGQWAGAACCGRESWVLVLEDIDTKQALKKKWSGTNKQCLLQSNGLGINSYCLYWHILKKAAMAYIDFGWILRKRQTARLLQEILWPTGGEQQKTKGLRAGLIISRWTTGACTEGGNISLVRCCTHTHRSTHISNIKQLIKQLIP